MDTDLLTQEYYKSTKYNHIPDTYTHQYTVGNSVCGDDITVYIAIKDGMITAYGYDGYPAMVTKAAAEFLGDFVYDYGIDMIVTWDQARVAQQGFVVSTRRIRSTVTALLAIQNCIHAYRNDGIVVDYASMGL